MKEGVTRFPLSWPRGWRRSLRRDIRRAPFRSGRLPVTVAAALDRLERELRLLNARDEILSSNVRLGLRGQPLSQQAEPEDRGAAVYFTWKGKETVFACDKWDRVADNMAAIAQHIDALRRISRYGVGELAQAFAGYVALPPSVSQWWDVLGLPSSATRADVEEAYRRLAKTHHPDNGGSHEAMAALNGARDAALAALR